MKIRGYRLCQLLMHHNKKENSLERPGTSRIEPSTPYRKAAFKARRCCAITEEPASELSLTVFLLPLSF